LLIGGLAMTFAAIPYRPHSKVRGIFGCSWIVTFPDFQGLGLAFILLEQLSAMYTPSE
jgi:hypothetical protein